MSWTTNSISKLKSLWEKGLSTSEIGKKLGFSKNAIVGKAHRLGLKPRASASTKTIKRKKMPAPVLTKQVEKTEKKETSSHAVKNLEPVILTAPKKLKRPIKVLGIMDLQKGMCRWPMGDPRSEDFTFCGQPAFKNKPYCLTHCSEAYTLSGNKSKDVKPDDTTTENDLID